MKLNQEIHLSKFFKSIKYLNLKDFNIEPNCSYLYEGNDNSKGYNNVLITQDKLIFFLLKSYVTEDKSNDFQNEINEKLNNFFNNAEGFNIGHKFYSFDQIDFVYVTNNRVETLNYSYVYSNPFKGINKNVLIVDRNVLEDTLGLTFKNILSLTDE